MVDGRAPDGADALLAFNVVASALVMCHRGTGQRTTYGWLSTEPRIAAIG